MTHLHNPDAIADLNQFTLRKLARTLVSTQGQFSWLWLQCNNISLREQIIQELKQLCPVKWRDLKLISSVTNLSQTINNLIGHQTPSALMITGVELLQDPDTFFSNLHFTQKEFAQNFPFPILIWLTDEMNSFLKHYAPDLRHNNTDPFRFEGIPTPTKVEINQQNSGYANGSKIKLPNPHFEEKIQRLSHPKTFQDNQINSNYFTENQQSNSPQKTTSGVSPHLSHSPTLPKVIDLQSPKINNSNSSSFSNFNNLGVSNKMSRGNLPVNSLNQISKIIILEPDNYDDIANIIDFLRADFSVLINFVNLSPQRNQRCLDFISGGTFALDGEQIRIGESLFLFTPASVKLSVGF